MSCLNHYFSVAEAISLVFYPHAEVVVHDLKSGLIVAIFNNFSKRHVGDISLIGELKEDGGKLPNVFPLYHKTNWDGRNIKSVSATLRNDKGDAMGLLCINLDLSKWEELHHFLGSWLHTATDHSQSTILFKDDWREKINSFVSNYLTQEKVTLIQLSKEKKRSLVLALYKEGAFKAKNAANYVADVLELSRATIYNYLKVSHHD